MHLHFRAIPFLCRICKVSECGREALDGLTGHLPYPHLWACVWNRFTWGDNNLLLAINWSAMDAIPLHAGKKKVSLESTLLSPSLVISLVSPGWVQRSHALVTSIELLALCGCENALQCKRHKIWFTLSHSTVINSRVSPWFIFDIEKKRNVRTDLQKGAARAGAPTSATLLPHP